MHHHNLPHTSSSAITARTHACFATIAHLAHPALRPELSAALQGLLDCAVQAYVKGLSWSRHMSKVCLAYEPNGMFLLDVCCPECRFWVDFAQFPRY